MKKTLFFYINTLQCGGAERVILQLAGRFAKIGYRCIMITSYVTQDEYAIPEGVERIVLETEKLNLGRIKRNAKRIMKLRQLCKLYRPQVLISFMAEPNFRAILATIGLPVKSIVSVRNDPTKEYSGKLYGFVGKYILPFADGCVFQTEDAKKWFPLRLQKKSVIIFNEVSSHFFETEYQGGEKIVTLGRLSAQKNQKMLINAFANIAGYYPNITLEIFGEGDLKQALTNQINELKLQDRIHLMGRTSDSAGVLKRSRIFVLTSDYEGMPNALMEALAVGVPCISTDCPCGGPKMIINDNYNGILVPVGDENALQNAMINLLDNKDLSITLSKNAKDSAAIFYPNKVFVEWKEFVEQIINCR